MTTAQMAGDGGRVPRSPATTRPPTTYTRVTDAVDRVQVFARDGYVWPDDCDRMALALGHLAEALDKLMRNNTVLAEGLELYVQRACDAVGLDGP